MHQRCQQLVLLPAWIEAYAAPARQQQTDGLRRR